MEKQHLAPGDPILIENIVNYLKAKGIFDEFRHECLADVDTKSSCQNLSQRVDGYTTKFLSGEKWHPDLNKNELRNKLRRHIDESGMLAGGADHVVEQVINPKINQLFLPRIIEVVHQYLNEENEKLNKKKDNSNDNASSDKSSVENVDATNKIKSTKLDPIADILSFSYSKPKSNPPQNVQTKVSDSMKSDRKKEENLHQAKVFDVSCKAEKKKEEPINSLKVPEVLLKPKKEDIALDSIQNIEKDKEENSGSSVSVKIESVEPVCEVPSPVPGSQTKSQNELKESAKIKKEIKTEESEAASDPAKKSPKEDIKLEKKKSDLEKDDSEKKKDDLKSNADFNSHSEENNQAKAVPSLSKSVSVVKNKFEGEKSKKVKSHSSSKTASNSGESQKSRIKDPDKFSNKSDKPKIASKVSKTSLKDHSSLHKSNVTSKSSKSDKADDSNKSKSKDGHSKTFDNSATSKSLSSKSSSIKKDITSAKLKTAKTKVSKSSDLKPDTKIQPESCEKSSKSSFHYSSYDSSQGSDQDRSSTSSSHHKEKHKHFSKHHKKESSFEKTEKTPEKKRFQSDSDSGTPMKHKHMKNLSEKEKKSLSIQKSAKINSRSNSFGSTSSVSDSPSSSSKEASASTSEETSDNSSKSSEAKKKQGLKEHCKQTKDFPPPPPPPPSSGISAPGSSSAEVSSMDETQSSQESESDSKISEDESNSESDVENLYSSNNMKNSPLQSKLKTPEILNDIYDIFLFSSSSSEFEGYSSSPEKSQVSMKQMDDVDVSSVNTSDLSSFDDLLSESDGFDSDVDEDRPTRRLTIEEAKKLLEEKAKKRRLERSKIGLLSKDHFDDKKSHSIPQICTSTLPSEDETSPVPEPKRESRRERKLNPKYASSEYTSIFDSKKTSFITKQMSSNNDKSENISPTTSETDIQHEKNVSPLKSRIPVEYLEANQSPNKDLKNSSCATVSCQAFEHSDNTKRKLSFESNDPNSWICESKMHMNSHERNHHVVMETESRSSIALKIKKSVIKNDNEINREPRPQGLKRKLEKAEKDDAKKLCRRNSDNSSSSESVPNENNPFNVKTNNRSSVFNLESKSKDFFHKQKINNNGVVLKMEHVKKKSFSKPNHVIEKQNSD